jgi:hypothetical protein
MRIDEFESRDKISLRNFAIPWRRCIMLFLIDLFIFKETHRSPSR